MRLAPDDQWSRSRRGGAREGDSKSDSATETCWHDCIWLLAAGGLAIVVELALGGDMGLALGRCAIFLIDRDERTNPGRRRAAAPGIEDEVCAPISAILRCASPLVIALLARTRRLAAR